MPERPPVRDLHRLRRSGSGAFGEERCAVPADDLDTGSLGEPGGGSGEPDPTMPQRQCFRPYGQPTLTLVRMRQQHLE
ncbi:hypothetical protein ACIO02_38500, partial [Streptomyces sp. NPDC087568]|uniref:hypothetical protein n=1 Tax=Streptomyces sp. NPDC087568 TaxID=3365799 RepID=UPI003803E4CB